MMKPDKWQIRFMERAWQVSRWSKDPSTKIGAVIVDEDRKQELSCGYNGFPRGIADDSRLDDRPTKYKLVVHGELNAILNAAHNGTKISGSSIFVWGLPICSECCKAIIQSGIRYVYLAEQFMYNERWQDSWEFSKKMFEESEVYVIILPREYVNFGKDVL